VAKRLGLLRELVPTAAHVAVLVNSADAARTATFVSDVGAAAADGLELRVFNASTISQIDASFSGFGQEQIDALNLLFKHIGALSRTVTLKTRYL
jgi:hypothetical protein